MGNTYGLALGDVDGDGDLDAWAANGERIDRLWLNDGAGTFVDSGQALGNYHNGDVAFGDFDGDGDLDAFVGGRSSMTSTVWMNDGRGVFQEQGRRNMSRAGTWWMWRWVIWTATAMWTFGCRSMTGRIKFG